MARGTTSTPRLCIEPALREGLSAVAVQKHRCIIAHVVYVRIRDYYGTNGTTMPEQPTLALGDDRMAKSAKYAGAMTFENDFTPNSKAGTA